MAELQDDLIRLRRAKRRAQSRERKARGGPGHGGTSDTSSLEAELAATQAALSSAQSTLTTAQQALADAIASGTATQEELDALQDDIDAAEAAVAAAEAGQAAAEAELALVAPSLASQIAANPSTYYVDIVNGNDSNPGVSAALPWQHSILRFTGITSTSVNPTNITGITRDISRNVGWLIKGTGIATGATLVSYNHSTGVAVMSLAATSSTSAANVSALRLLPPMAAGTTLKFRAGQRHVDGGDAGAESTTDDQTFDRYDSGADPIIDHTFDALNTLTWAANVDDAGTSVLKTYCAKYTERYALAPQRMDMLGGVGQHHGLPRAASAGDVAKEMDVSVAWTNSYGAIYTKTVTFGDTMMPGYYSINNGAPKLFKEHQYDLTADGDAYARVAGTTLTVFVRSAGGNPGGSPGAYTSFTVSGAWFATRGSTFSASSSGGNTLTITDQGAFSRLTKDSGSSWTNYQPGDTIYIASVDNSLNNVPFIVASTSGANLDLTTDIGVTATADDNASVTNATIHLRVFSPNGVPSTNWTSFRPGGYTRYSGGAARGMFVGHNRITVRHLDFEGADEGIDVSSPDIVDCIIEYNTVRLCNTRGGRNELGSHRTKLRFNRFDSIGELAQAAFGWKWGSSAETDATGCEAVGNVVSYCGEDAHSTQLKSGCTILFKDIVSWDNYENIFDDKSGGEITRIGNFCVSGLWSTGPGSDCATGQADTKHDWTDEYHLSNRTNGVKVSPRTNGKAKRLRVHCEQARALFAGDDPQTTGGRDGKWIWESCEFTTSDNGASNPAGAIALGAGDHDFLHCLGYLISGTAAYFGVDITPETGVTQMLVRFYNSLLGSASTSGATSGVFRRNAAAALTGVILELHETGYDFPLNGTNWGRESTAPTDHTQASIDAGVATAILIIDNLLADPTQPIPFTNPWKGMSWSGGNASGVGCGTLTKAFRALGASATAAQLKAAGVAAWTEAAGDWSIGGSLREIPITAGTAFIRGEKVTSSNGGTAWVRDYYSTYMIVSDVVGTFSNGGTLTGNRAGAATQNGSISSAFTLELLAFDNQSGAFTEGLVLTSSGGGTAKIVRIQDDGTTGWLVLANRVGTIADNNTLTDTGTGAADANGATGSTQFRRAVNALTPQVLRDAANVQFERLFINASSSRTIAATSGTKTFTFSSGDLDADAAVTGYVIDGSTMHFTVGANNGTFTVVSHTATTIVVSEAVTTASAQTNAIALGLSGVSMGARKIAA